MLTIITRRTQLSLLAVALLSFVGILIETSMNVTFPTLIAAMHVPLTIVSWLTTGYLLLVTVVMGATAYLLKRFSERTLFAVACGFCLGGTLACAAAPNFAVLLAGRLLQAVATGVATPLLFELIFTRVPRRQLGLYTGLAEMLISLAPALGPTYGGLMASVFSWRGIFWCVLPVIAGVAVLGLATIRKAAVAGAGRFDALGLTLLALFFTSLVTAFTLAGQRGFASTGFWLALLVALLALVAQICHAWRGRTQLLDWRILREPVLSLRLVTYFLLQFINIGASFVIPMLVEDGLGHSAMQAGLVLFPGAAVGAVVAPLAGRLYDRRGIRGLIVASTGVVALGTLLFTALGQRLGLLGILALFVLVRIGFNLGFGNLMSAASQLVTGRHRADQNALFNMLQQYAGSLGTGVLAAVIASQTLSRGKATLATLRGCQLSFGVLLGLAVLALLAAVVANRLSSRQTAAGHNLR
ncbi:MFS transporter [Lacticaseibacillus suihuaensis]